MRQALGVEARLIPGEGGIFEVIADGDIVYEKAKTGRFPEAGEVLKMLSS